MAVKEIVDMNKYHIPQSLDAPFKILYFTMFDVGMMFVTFMLVGVIGGQQMLAFLVSAFLYFTFSIIKGDEYDHYFKHWIYWNFPSFNFYKITPPSHVREILG